MTKAPTGKALDAARQRGRPIWLGAAAALAAAAAIWGVGAWVESRSIAALRRNAEGSSALRVAVLRSEINKQRALPLVLADDAELKQALRSRAPSALRALDAKLEALAAQAQAPTLYVLDARGDAVAASNWRQPDSFVGSHYGFRAYYFDALQHGEAEQFAFGNVSHHPGLYISRRVNDAAGPLGVVVVKLEFGGLEKAWRLAGDPAYVVDRKGVVLITSEPSWRFRTLGRLDAATLAGFQSNHQFGDFPLAPLPLRRDGGVLRLSDQGGRKMLDSPVAAPVAGWTLHLLTPIAPAEQAAAAARWIVALASGLVALLGGYGAAAVGPRRGRQRPGPTVWPSSRPCGRAPKS
jgi:two-component system C4-dicarboxylate transport sensor histidine kinase DctB